MKKSFLALLLMALTLFACGEREVLVTQIYSGPMDVSAPEIPQGAVGQNEFSATLLAPKIRRAVGFLVETGENKVFVSALHVFASPWALFKGREANQLMPHHLVLGTQVLAETEKAHLPAHAGLAKIEDTRGDFVICSLKSTEAGAQFLPLRMTDLEIGEPVWVYTVTTVDPNKALPYKARLGAASNRFLRLDESTAPHDLISGSPVVDREGKVIGIVVLMGSGSHESNLWAVPLAALQKAL